jgi:TPP-dependent pyruvate/acetoin dehydrogenase alpha subunit
MLQKLLVLVGLVTALISANGKEEIEKLKAERDSIKADLKNEQMKNGGLTKEDEDAIDKKIDDLIDLAAKAVVQKEEDAAGDGTGNTPGSLGVQG